MPQIMSRAATCRTCQKTHQIFGTSGQTVTIEATCECGQKLRLTTEFPKI